MEQKPVEQKRSINIELVAGVLVIALVFVGAGYLFSINDDFRNIVLWSAGAMALCMLLIAVGWAVVVIIGKVVPDQEREAGEEESQDGAQQ